MCYPTHLYLFKYKRFKAKGNETPRLNKVYSNKNYLHHKTPLAVFLKRYS